MLFRMQMNGKKVRLCVGKLPAGDGPFTVSLVACQRYVIDPVMWLQTAIPQLEESWHWHCVVLPYHVLHAHLGKIQSQESVLLVTIKAVQHPFVELHHR